MPDFPSQNHQPEAARVAVVAAGVVSPLGFGLDETLLSLREARDCVTPVTSFPVEHCRCKTAGQVPDERLAEVGKTQLHSRRLHRVARMMIFALGEALAQSPGFQPELTVVGTTSGGMTFGEEYYRGLKNGRTSSP
jgi:3-oxoacyl-[acyl-carrier-protein] synthase II